MNNAVDPEKASLIDEAIAAKKVCSQDIAIMRYYFEKYKTDLTAAKNVMQSLPQYIKDGKIKDKLSKLVEIAEKALDPSKQPGEVVIALLAAQKQALEVLCS